ncbi:MAG TPA: Calx-beta domain-containing protein [Tepidisphaeraceae bacterium]
MKSRLLKSRRNRLTSQRALSSAVDTLEARTLLSTTPTAITIQNAPTGSPVVGSLTVSVDPFGAFGESFPQSGALYDPFPSGNGNPYNSVRVSALYFQPAGGFLSAGYVLPDQTAADAATNVQFTQPSANTAISTFTIDGFQITLTQTIADVPTSDSVTYMTQTYQIKDVSNTQYINTPFNVVHLLYADRTDGSISNWGALSGDNRIGITFTSKDENSVFQRIDALGVDSAGNTVYDWDTTNSPSGFDITNEAATSSNDPNYYQTIVADSGIPAGDNGNVAGETNGDLIDDTTPPAGNAEDAVVAVQDSLEFTQLGQTITYITRTGWGDTGDETPAIYHQPGTFNITALTPTAPEGTDAVLQITRTDGSLGHASVFLNDNDLHGTATGGAPTNANADFQEIVANANNAGNGILPPLNVILADGETTTGVGSYSDNPTIAVFNDTKIEPSEFFFAVIENPQDNALLANGDTPTSPPTDTGITIPANDQPSAFHFASSATSADQPTGFTQSYTWTEGQTAQIIVERDLDDGGNPNTGPYGAFAVNYTITGSGSNQATPGEEVNGVITPANADFIDVTPGLDGTPGSSSTYSDGTITGSLQFAAATPDQINTPTQGVNYQYIDLNTLVDNLYEGNETFTITLQSGNALLVGTPSTFTGTIDDAQTSGPVHLQNDSQSVTVSPTSTVSQTIGVLRTEATGAGQVTVDYTVNGSSATAGSDFTVPGGVLSGNSYTGTLTFAAGASTPTDPLVIDFPANDEAGADKTLTITISLPSDQDIPGLIGAPSTETLTLNNNNAPGVIHFVGSSTQTVAEGTDPITGAPYKIVTLQVTRDPSDGAEGAVSVNYSTSDGTATSSGTTPDYQTATGTLTWADGQTGTQDIQVKIYDNTSATFPIPNKDFSVNLSDPTGGAALGTPSSVVITITDNQQPGVNFSNTSYTAYEKDPSTGQPGTANIVVERDMGAGQSSAAWTFTYTVIQGTALAGVDYVAPTSSTNTVTVTDPTQNTYTIQIPILEDSNNVNDTTFSVRLIGATVGTDTSALGSSIATTVTITNADTDIALAQASYTTAPGSRSVPIIINRTGQSEGDVTVSYTTVDGTAIAGTDYTATTGSVTIPAGQNSVTVNVPILTPAGTTQATKSFSFKITNALLSDPTDFGNSVNVNFSSTPATVSIAGQVTVTGIQLLSGKNNAINRVVITFSDPLNPAGVPNLNNYVLATIGKKNAFNKQIGFTNAQYDASTQSVTLYTKTSLSKNKLYQLSIRSDGGIISMSNQPFVTGTPGGLGGTQVATFSRGTKVTYTDPDGDIVTLKTNKGGSMDFINGVNGGYPSLSLTGTTKSQLTGSLKPLGDGHTFIASITNPDGVQDLLELNPQFTID